MLKKLAALGGAACVSVIAGVYALSSSNNNRYKNKIPSYKKTFDAVRLHLNKDLLLKDPEDNKGWSERGKEFKKFYKGDGQDFRDKCFSSIESAGTELDSIFGESASFYSTAEEVDLVPTFSFTSLCVYKNSPSG